MSDHFKVNSAELDRYITGNYGEDQFKNVRRRAPKHCFRVGVTTETGGYTQRDFQNQFATRNFIDMTIHRAFKKDKVEPITIKLSQEF